MTGKGKVFLSGFLFCIALVMMDIYIPEIFREWRIVSQGLATGLSGSHFQREMWEITKSIWLGLFCPTWLLGAAANLYDDERLEKVFITLLFLRGLVIFGNVFLLVLTFTVWSPLMNMALNNFLAYDISLQLIWEMAKIVKMDLLGLFANLLCLYFAFFWIAEAKSRLMKNEEFKESEAKKREIS